jgi:hypothetical protein
LAAKSLFEYLRANIELPLDLDLTAKNEHILFDNDRRVNRCHSLIGAYLDFIRVFMDDLRGSLQNKNRAVLQMLVDVLNDPLINLNLEYYDDLRLNQASIDCCLKAFQLVADLAQTNDLFNMLFSLDVDMESREPIGFLAYLVYVKNFGCLGAAGSTPMVYTHLHIFEKLTPFICSLLKTRHQFSIDKGLNFDIFLVFILSRPKRI